MTPPLGSKRRIPPTVGAPARTAPPFTVAPIFAPSGARAPDRSPAIPPPRKVRHVRTLWWWLALLGIVLGVRLGTGGPAKAPAPPPQAAPGPEKEAFIALVFGRVGADPSGAIAPDVLREQLARLKQSGAQAVRLADVQAFLERRVPLPAKPVLLVFDEARRETIEAVDPILTELELPAVAFVNVEGLEQANVGLVSRRRLAAMGASGHWEVGISACHAPPAAATATATTTTTTDFNAADLRRRRTSLQTWAKQPALAISCLSGWTDASQTEARWSAALSAASLPLGFVARPPGANHHDDPPSMLRLVRITEEDREPDALLRRVAAYTPRHERFVDNFSGHALANDWVASRRHARVEGGTLRLTAKAADPGGSLTLGGTEQWRDTQTTVHLAARPTGQFWIYARRSDAGPFLRLGITDGRVVLQKSDADGQTRQVAAREIPRGDLRLTLRTLGSRALAFVDDEPLLERPTELPDDLRQGSVALVVWDDASDASVNLRSVAIEPLPPRVALLDADPEDQVFDDLRREADQLSAISPRLFWWRAGKGSEASAGLPLEIFVRHHHIAMLPAVTVEKLPGAKDWGKFTEAMLRWADVDGYDGLNVVVNRIDPDDMGRIEQLRRSIGARGKELTVTVRHMPELPEVPGYIRQANAGSASLQVAGAPQRRPG